MKKLLSNKGLSLIELLASLTIFSIIIALVSGILINSTNYFDKTKNKVSLSQEANLILAQITKAHQTTQTYTLSSHLEEGRKQINLNGEAIKHPDLHIDILHLGQNDYKTFDGTTMIIDTKNPLFIELKVSDINNSQVNFQIRSVINRYTKGGS